MLRHSVNLHDVLACSSAPFQDELCTCGQLCFCGRKSDREGGVACMRECHWSWIIFEGNWNGPMTAEYPVYVLIQKTSKKTLALKKQDEKETKNYWWVFDIQRIMQVEVGCENIFDLHYFCAVGSALVHCEIRFWPSTLELTSGKYCISQLIDLSCIFFSRKPAKKKKIRENISMFIGHEACSETSRKFLINFFMCFIRE